MGQVIVRNLDDRVADKLKRKAADQNKSLEQFLRESPGDLVRADKAELLTRAREIRQRSRPVTIDATVLIRQDRDSR